MNDAGTPRNTSRGQASDCRTLSRCARLIGKTLGLIGFALFGICSIVFGTMLVAVEGAYDLLNMACEGITEAVRSRVVPIGSSRIRRIE